jgi:hypothetical protein
MFEIILTCECTKAVGACCISFTCKSGTIAILTKGGTAAVGAIAAIEGVNKTAQIFPSSEYLKRLSWASQFVRDLPLTVIKGIYENVKDKSYNYYFCQYSNEQAFLKPIFLMNTNKNFLNYGQVFFLLFSLIFFSYRFYFKLKKRNESNLPHPHVALQG